MRTQIPIIPSNKLASSKVNKQAPVPGCIFIDHRLASCANFSARAFECHTRFPFLGFVEVGRQVFAWSKSANSIDDYVPDVFDTTINRSSQCVALYLRRTSDQSIQGSSDDIVLTCYVESPSLEQDEKPDNTDSDNCEDRGRVDVEPWHLAFLFQLPFVPLIPPHEGSVRGASDFLRP